MKKLSTVFIISTTLAFIFTLWGTLAPNHLTEVTQEIQSFLQTKFGWFYLISVSLFLLFAIILIFSRVGNIRLGRDDEEPEYSLTSWFAMLFSAGMGIGLVFWGVAEPLSHFADPPTGDGLTNVQPETAGSAQVAMRYSFFHWGLHPWAIYAVVALALAYFQFRKGTPGLISSTFTPLLGEKTKGSIGKGIDILAVFATVFGVATSLGLGAIQISGGLSFLFDDINNTFLTQLAIIIVMSALFILSAITGIDRGIKFLSNTNVVLAVLLMMFFLFSGPTNFIINFFTTTIGSYVQQLASMSLRITPFPDTDLHAWIQGWTIFYWAWWISWAPFVGMFIARISKGRTIREFVIGVLTVPTLFSFLWFAVLGGTGLHLEMFGQGGILEAMNNFGSEVALFKVLEQLPLGAFSSAIAILLISTFFITSADSAAFVLGIQTTRGNLNPSMAVKVTWGVILTTAAIILLYSGGLGALQTAAVIAAFPFAFILIGMCLSLIKALRKEKPLTHR